jgi:hypothetical protein
VAYIVRLLLRAGNGGRPGVPNLRAADPSLTRSLKRPPLRAPRHAAPVQVFLNCSYASLKKYACLPFLSSNFVSRQAVAFGSTLNANKANDVIAVIFMDAHTPITEGEVKSVSRVGSAEVCHDLRMTEDVE